MEISGVYQRFRVLNELYFDGLFPNDLKISLSRRLYRKAGICLFQVINGTVRPIEIRLSSKYLELYPDDLENVLLHELIHLKLGHINHDNSFVEELQRLNKKYGLHIRVKGKPLFFKYGCKICGKEYLVCEKIKDLSSYVCSVCFSKIEEIGG